MIDYDKLKIAHGLMHEYQGDKPYVVSMQFCGANKEPMYCFGGDLPYMYLDDLIDKLRDLTKPEQKYAIGQEVWYVIYGQDWTPIRGEIKAINPKSFCCFVDGNLWPQHKLYPTKQDLIEAQIEYWENLKIEEISASTTCPKCGMQRVADGMCWAIGCDYKITPFESPLESFNTNPDEYCQVSGVKLDKKKCPYDENGCPRCNPCQHEDDGKQYGPMEWGASAQYKCIKCGEFYR